MEVAGRGEPALRHHEHVGAEALDLVEHVARDDHAAALGAEPLEELDHVGALARIEAGQRLVQHDQPRVVDDRLRELDALAHALRVGGQPPLVGRVELDGLERRPGGAVGIAEAVQPGREAHEPERGERLEHVFLLRHEPELPGDVDVGARIAAEDPHRALRGPGEPQSIRSIVDLPAPFGPSSAVTPGPMSKLTSETATTFPNHFETPRTSISASPAVRAHRRLD